MVRVNRIETHRWQGLPNAHGCVTLNQLSNALGEEDVLPIAAMAGYKETCGSFDPLRLLSHLNDAGRSAIERTS